MKRVPRSNAYLRVRRYVDGELARIGGQTVVPLLGAVPLAGMAFAQLHLGFAAAVAGWALATILAVSWTSFVIWRGVRLVRAQGLKSDRRFDQRDKYRLAPEYHASESVLAASRRARRRRKAV